MKVATFELLTLPRATALAQSYATTGDVETLEDLDRARATGLFGEFYKSKNDHWSTLAPRMSDVLRSGSDVHRSMWEVSSRIFQVSPAHRSRLVLRRAAHARVIWAGRSIPPLPP